MSNLSVPDASLAGSVLPVAKLLRDLEGVRKMILEKLAPVSREEALAVPRGLKNNLHWHLGHLIYVQSSALYIRAGQASPIPKSFREYFGNGTSPEGYDSLVPDWDELLEVAREFSRDLASIHAVRAAQPLVRPINLMNISAATVGEAVPFLLVHEGEHLARIKQLLQFSVPVPD